MTVEELNQNEIDELKESYFYSDENTLPAMYPADIPNKIIFDFYNGIDFVKDDFFCNIDQ